MANLWLSISYQDPPGQILLSPSTEMEDEDWKSVVSWWAPGNQFAAADRELVLPLTVFAQRIEWLRAVWRPRGGGWEISETAKSAIRGVKALETQFEDLISGDKLVPGAFEDPRSLLKTLEPDQRSNVSYLMSMRNGANFSVPGAGKTLTALTVWAVLRGEGAVGTLLVICPRSAFEAWTEEAETAFGPPFSVSLYKGEPLDEDIEIVLTNYEQLENVDKQRYLAMWVQRRRAMVVLDEAHRVKSGPKSKRWRGCAAVVANASRVDLLTGTPMPQDPTDLVGIFRLSWPGLPPEFFSPSRLSRMKRNTAFVRTTKSELGLPPTSVQSKAERMSPIQADIYDALVEKYAGKFRLTLSGEKMFARRGKAVMSLIAAASNPGLLSGKDAIELGLDLRWPPAEVTADDSLMALVHGYLEKELPWKFKFAVSETTRLANQNKKLLIWTSFVGNINALERLLEPFEPAVVFGQIDQESRDSEIRRFRTSTDCSVLITNPQTLGEGISLHHHCHNALYIDRTYNAGQYLQSIDRIHRRGLPDDVITDVKILKSKSSIDERVDLRLSEKVAKLGEFLDDPNLAITSLPGDDEDLSWIDWLGVSQVDLDDALSHLMPTR